MDLTVTRELAARPDQIWRAWSEPDYLERWWGPAGFTVPVVRVDFAVGGTTLIGMRAPGGPTLYNTWTYSAISPYDEIEFELRFCDAEGNELEPATLGLPLGVPNGIRHLITFSPTAGGGTAMTLTEYGYTTDEARTMSRLGLDQTLDKLAALFS